MPTTDEMDKTTPQERSDLVGKCRDCGKASRFEYGNQPRCECGGYLDTRTIQSYRTYSGKIAYDKRKL